MNATLGCVQWPPSFPVCESQRVREGIGAAERKLVGGLQAISGAGNLKGGGLQTTILSLRQMASLK